MTKKNSTSSRRNSKSLTSTEVRAFRKKVHDHFREHGRDLPWRKRVNPYRVLISEIMLQQTQVDRVIEKYKEFLAIFPTFADLAAAPLPQLLSLWSGLGYNRRALALKALAQKVVDEHKGRLPSDRDQLLALPGIGNYTAGAVMAFAFNKPVVFMDTNIRRVYIHEFFQDRQGVHDDELIPLVERTMDPADPRTWYNALMDYGTMLKQQHANPNRRSAHYTRQSPFENSSRQVRGRILKILVADAPLTALQIVKRVAMEAERVKSSLVQMEKEGFIRKKGRLFVI
ncbi:MAG: endonuclease III [Nitrospirae bacterium GWC2_56_14]|nr:MAG: endonuclease III [Nitrospirae bacterium GWC2_56_14]